MYIITKSTRTLSNEERYKAFQKVKNHGDTGQSPSSNRGNYSQPSGWEVFCRIITVLFWLTLIAAGLFILWAIPHYGIEPETRTFDRPIQNDTYQRTQNEWEIIHDTTTDS